MKRKKDGGASKAAAQKLAEKTLADLCNSPAFTNPQEAYLATLDVMSFSKAETPVTVKLWRQLYEAAQAIYKLEPWKHVDETMHFTLLLPGRNEPVYIVVMGSGGVTCGIGIYPGFESLRRLLNVGDIDEEDMTAVLEQYCINLYFSDDDDLAEHDQKVMKKIGFSYDGENEIPYFRSMKPGFLPWFINRDEAKLTLEALQNFTMAFLAYSNEDVDVDFDNGQTLLRFYDSDSDMWYNAGVKMPPVPFVEPKMLIPDDLASRLKKKKKNKAKLGFIMTYIPVPYQKSAKHRPKMPLVAFLADMTTGTLVDHSVGLGDETGNLLDEREHYLGFLIGYVMDNGRPASIAVANEDTYNFLQDFALKLGIKLVEDNRLMEIVSMFVDAMSMLESEEEEDEEDDDEI